VKLTEYLEVLAYDIAFWMSAYLNPSYSLDDLGDVTANVTGKLRAAAIIALLAKGNSDSYFHNLIRSGRCRLQYLQRLQAAGRAADHHQASARCGPFLDAVAAADFGLARQIAALSPTAWLQGHEYEDDYCYAQLLHAVIAAQRDQGAVEKMVQRFETALAGRQDARLPCVQALLQRDQAAFDSAFEALLGQRTKEIEAEKARHKIEEPPLIAQRQVYVEGLALLRIADRLGIVTQSEYLYCPSLARVPMQAPFPGE